MTGRGEHIEVMMFTWTMDRYGRIEKDLPVRLFQDLGQLLCDDLYDKLERRHDRFPN